VFEAEPSEPLYPWDSPKIRMDSEWLYAGSDGAKTLGSEPWETVVEDDGRSCSDDIRTLTNFSNRLWASQVPYHLLGPNSNSATSGALNTLGVQWQPTFWAPGWGVPLK